MKQKPNPTTQSCPCGSPAYASCCEAVHEGRLPVRDARTLMRSRYSAYAMKLEGYLLQTWHISTRPRSLDLHTDESPKWLGLEIKHFSESENTAVVEFVARFKTGGRASRLHEISNFVRENGCWYYVDGRFPYREKPHAAQGNLVS